MERPTLSRKIYTRRASFALTLAFLVLGGLLAAFSVYALRAASLLAREGVDTRGTVIDRSTSTTRRSNGSTSHTYTLVLRFSGPDGAPVEVRPSVSQSLYDASSVGTEMPIRYARSHPTTVELTIGETGRTGTIIGIAAAGFGLAMLISLVFLWRGVSAQRRAALTGERRLAQVTEHKRVGKAKSGQSAFLWDAGGTRGRSHPMRDDLLPAVGAEVPVYVDPRSGRGWWEGDF